MSMMGSQKYGFIGSRFRITRFRVPRFKGSEFRVAE
jgi:hypothetical protein